MPTEQAAVIQSEVPDPGSKTGWLRLAGVSLLLAACAWGLGYLVVATPGPWFTDVSSVRVTGERLIQSRGVGRIAGNNYLVVATDQSGLAIASLAISHLRASDFRRVRWFLGNVPADASLTLLWRSDRVPGRVNSAPLVLHDNVAQIVLTPGEREWVGNIEGLALAVKGTLATPLVISGVSIEPMGVADVISDLSNDWLTFIPWSGMSINTAFGGPPEQTVWLPVVVAVVALTAIGLCVLWRRRPGHSGVSVSLVATAIVVAAWLILDARWLWLRWQQTESTQSAFAGKLPRDKHLIDVDGYVYAFAEQVRARLPKSSARVYVAADDHYFAARLAYHLLPHNTYLDHGSLALPPASQYKPGEYIVVFRRNGVRYDTVQQTLSWDDQPPLRVQLLLAHLGNALFKIL
jgi:hypothetical protein